MNRNKGGMGGTNLGVLWYPPSAGLWHRQEVDGGWSGGLEKLHSRPNFQKCSIFFFSTPSPLPSYDLESQFQDNSGFACFFISVATVLKAMPFPLVCTDLSTTALHLSNYQMERGKNRVILKLFSFYGTFHVKKLEGVKILISPSSKEEKRDRSEASQ